SAPAPGIGNLPDVRSTETLHKFLLPEHQSKLRRSHEEGHGFSGDAARNEHHLLRQLRRSKAGGKSQQDRLFAEAACARTAQRSYFAWAQVVRRGQSEGLAAPISAAKPAEASTPRPQIAASSDRYEVSHARQESCCRDNSRRRRQRGECRVAQRNPRRSWLPDDLCSNRRGSIAQGHEWRRRSRAA